MSWMNREPQGEIAREPLVKRPPAPGAARSVQEEEWVARPGRDHLDVCSSHVERVSEEGGLSQ